MSLTLAEARVRAAAVSQVAYDIALDLTDPRGDTFGCRTVVTFTAHAPSTFLELTAAQDLRVMVDGAVVTDPAYDGRRLHLTGLGGSHRVEVEARLPYLSDGDGMHRMTDPADGEVYLGAYCGMDIAQKVFCCFDQNDLKAPITLAVRAEPGVTVLANGLATTTAAEQRDGRWAFTTTPPIPTALFVVAAGRFAAHRFEHAGMPFGWYARASLGEALERDAEELQRITLACYEHYADLFTEPYPFDSYDQVFVPGLNWGAQEMPGCVTYRDELLPLGAMSSADRLLRAEIIAHEMSHMWFGDLVTMTWWEDTWLQESFADYMGFRVAADAAGYAGAQASFELGQKPAAYAADRRRSTHPVAARPEDVPDVDAAATIFDAISYAKGNAVLRQLVTWLGDETFLSGVNAYLTRFRFGNATLPDLVEAFAEAAPGRDVRGWVEAWLRTTGFDTITVHRGDDVPVLRRRGTRPHRFTVTAYDTELREVGSRMVDLADDPVALVEFAGRVVVVNAYGETYAEVAHDDVSLSHLRAGLTRIDDPLVRAVLWGDLLQGPAADVLDLVRDQLPHEADASLAAAIVRRLTGPGLYRDVPPAQVEDALAVVAAACGDGIAASGDDVDRVRALLPGWAAGTRAVGALRGALDEGRVGPLDLTLTERWQLLVRLASLGELDEEAIEAERLAAPGVVADLGAARARAARPAPEAKAGAWAAAADPAVDNRRFATLMAGLWSSSRTELSAPYVARYLREAPAWAARGQAFAQVVGRAAPPQRLTPSELDLLRHQLVGDLPTVLRRQWDDWVDDLGA